MATDDDTAGVNPLGIGFRDLEIRESGEMGFGLEKEPVNRGLVLRIRGKGTANAARAASMVEYLVGVWVRLREKEIEESLFYSGGDSFNPTVQIISL